MKPRILSDQFEYLYVEMGRIRGIEVALAHSYEDQMMRCPMHLSIGQEYWLPLISCHYQAGDRFYSSHRSHGLYLALKGDLRELVAEIHGHVDGCMAGIGGSMHLKSIEKGLICSVPIVGSSIALALGSAFASKHLGSQILTVAYFGDGACEEGIFHESLNLAALYKLPILFLCENNLYSCNTNLDRRQPSMDMARFARAHCIEDFLITQDLSYQVIVDTFARAYTSARTGPVFLQCLSYRLYEHCGHREDFDNGDRNPEEYELMKEKDLLSSLMAAYPSVKSAYQLAYDQTIKLCEHYTAFNLEFLLQVSPRT